MNRLVRSMTGYGRAEGSFSGCRISVEVRSVNNRYLDCSVRIPRTYLFAEDSLKSLVKETVSRGKVDVFVTIEHEDGGETAVRVSEQLALSYLAAFRRLRELGGSAVRGTFDVTELARFPEVLTVEKREEDPEETAAAIRQVLSAALEGCDAMRIREGEKLKEDILSRTASIETMVGFVEERSPKTVEEYRAKLEARMQEVLQNAQLDEARILTEAAIFADKVAVAEETVRLRSHIAQLREMLEAGGAVGRKLDFLIQEFNREANTIGSKCSDLEVTRTVVDIKAEIEKIREQVQNLE